MMVFRRKGCRERGDIVMRRPKHASPRIAGGGGWYLQRQLFDQSLPDPAPATLNESTTKQYGKQAHVNGSTRELALGKKTSRSTTRWKVRRSPSPPQTACLQLSRIDSPLFSRHTIRMHDSPRHLDKQNGVRALGDQAKTTQMLLQPQQSWVPALYAPRLRKRRPQGHR